jgi:hypothetical protein
MRAAALTERLGEAERWIKKLRREVDRQGHELAGLRGGAPRRAVGDVGLARRSTPPPSRASAASPLSAAELSQICDRLSAEARAREDRECTPGPTEEQWRAVRLALEKITGRGRYSVFGGVVFPLPVSIRWDDPDLDRTRVAAETAIFAEPECCVVVFRSDRTPAEIHRSALHEFQHCADAELIRAGLPTEMLEARALAAVGRLEMPWEALF